jgi:hypothetical protein
LAVSINGDDEADGIIITNEQDRVDQKQSFQEHVWRDNACSKILLKQEQEQDSSCS